MKYVDESERGANSITIHRDDIAWALEAIERMINERSGKIEFTNVFERDIGQGVTVIHFDIEETPHD